MHTKDKLADALKAVGLEEMSVLARTGYYHDFLSPLDTPTMQLVQDLFVMSERHSNDRDAIMALRAAVINGDYDANLEESDEWAASPEGQYAFNQLTKKDK